MPFAFGAEYVDLLIKVDFGLSMLILLISLLGDSPAVELSSSFVILAVCSLIILIVLIANCVSCCKDPEIDFKVSMVGKNI